ncbi:MAG: DsbA family protein [Candidatus Rokubacteria bacterium]|nr:DsbA family protein [Candidatus Rokubacteria bacterium]
MNASTTSGWLLPAVLAIALLVGGGAPVAAQPVEDLRKEIEALKQDQAAIRKEIAEIKALLRGRGAAAPSSGGLSDVRLAVQGAPALGQDSARVTIVEFSDYQCPFCRRHSSDVFPEIVKDYVKTGKVRYVFRDFPIASLHPQAHRLHEAAHCAGDQGRYWQMHERLFEESQRSDTKDLVARARALGLDGPRFERCLAGGVHATRVRQGVADAEKARVRGTPSFFLGFTERDGAPIQPQRLVVGAQPYEAFKQAIDGLLAERP